MSSGPSSAGIGGEAGGTFGAQTPVYSSLHAWSEINYALSRRIPLRLAESARFRRQAMRNVMSKRKAR